MDYENFTEIEKQFIEKKCDIINLYTDQKINPNLKCDDDSEFSCSNCQKIYKYSEVKNLTFKFHCEKCQNIAFENVERLQKILFNEDKKKEEEESKKKDECNKKNSCDNDKCIYLNPEKKWHFIGFYQFCPDCFYSIGRHVAINGFY
jgi:hypothetical protein